MNLVAWGLGFHNGFRAGHLRQLLGRWSLENKQKISTQRSNTNLTCSWELHESNLLKDVFVPPWTVGLCRSRLRGAWLIQTEVSHIFRAPCLQKCVGRVGVKFDLKFEISCGRNLGICFGGGGGYFSTCQERIRNFGGEFRGRFRRKIRKLCFKFRAPFGGETPFSRGIMWTHLAPTRCRAWLALYTPYTCIWEQHKAGTRCLPAQRSLMLAEPVSPYRKVQGFALGASHCTPHRSYDCLSWCVRVCMCALWSCSGVLVLAILELLCWPSKSYSHVQVCKFYNTRHFRGPKTLQVLNVRPILLFKSPKRSYFATSFAIRFRNLKLWKLRFAKAEISRIDNTIEKGVLELQCSAWVPQNCRGEKKKTLSQDLFLSSNACFLRSHLFGPFLSYKYSNWEVATHSKTNSYHVVLLLFYWFLMFLGLSCGFGCFCCCCRCFKVGLVLFVSGSETLLWGHKQTKKRRGKKSKKQHEQDHWPVQVETKEEKTTRKKQREKGLGHHEVTR